MTLLKSSKILILFISVALWCSSPLPVRAQSHGTFSATGDMKTPRRGHTGTLMLNGKVLISGGAGAGAGFLLSLETFDPATGEFIPAGEADFLPRAAVLLPNGKVLLLGFTDQRMLWGQLYNPEDGTLSEGYTLMATEFQKGLVIYYAGLLPTGKILLITDSPDYFTVFDVIELQEDGASGRFTGIKKADFFTNWYDPGETTPLADGRVLIALCCDPNRIYDPRTGGLGFAGSRTLATGCYGYRVALLVNGRVLSSGGDCDFGPGSNVNFFDPATNNVVAAGLMLRPRSFHALTLLGDGKLLISGGGIAFQPDSELYDSSAGDYSPTGEMIVPRAGHSATLLPDGRLLIAGGNRVQSPFGGTNSAEIYTPSVLVPAPSLFSLSGDGKGQGAILRAGTGRPATPANPTRAGEALEIFLTGLLDGAVIPPQVSIGGRMAEVLYFGRAPGLANTNQINVRVPAGVAPGAAVPVRLMYLGRPSNEVTIAVQ